GARHELRRTDRPVRRGTGPRDCVLETGAGPPRNRRAGVLEGSREQGAGSSVTRQRLLPARRSLLALMTLSGLLLALHFWSWIASLRFTTVASSVVLVSLKPVFAWGIAAAWLREHPTRAEAWGIAL